MIKAMLKENERRHSLRSRPFDPLTGLNSPGTRTELLIPGLSTGPLFLPAAMLAEPMMADLTRCGSVDRYIDTLFHRTPDDTLRQRVADMFDRLRCRHDFPYWAARYAYIKSKGGGPDRLFILNRPQRILVERLEAMREAGRPIRLILLKARQWGGSTCIQLYMAWMQLTHATGLNSLIIAHQGAATEEIKDMFDRLIGAYPDRMLRDIDDEQPPKRKLTRVGRSGASVRLEQRNCKIKVGSAERPDSARGGDYNLVHLSEVGMWKKTLGKSPEDIVRSACSGVLFEPGTMIAFESTANGTGNFFAREYEAARRGESQFEPLFVRWHDIDHYSLPVADPEAFAERLLLMRSQTEAQSVRRQPGRYLWWLWEQGATLEAINWYIAERAKYSDHGQMASEYPSDDVEAFVHSGARVFDRYKVEALRVSCRPPSATGEVSAHADYGGLALTGLHFTPDAAGALSVWEMPAPDTSPRVTDRYLAVVDIGGRSHKADWSVVAVFDRLLMADGGVPVLVAQWRGHIDIDLLAWKAAQIAAFYCDALLVVESNTLETHDRERWVDGDQSHFILNQIRDVYPRLYARRRSEEEIRIGAPTRYGFHTNTATKPMIISSLVRFIREGMYVERCEECLDEYLAYERRPNGSYGAIAGRHDDILMTRAIGLHICFHEMPLPVVRTSLRASPGRIHSFPGSEASLF